MKDCLVKTTDQDVYNSATLAATLGNAKALDVILRTNHGVVKTIDRDRKVKLIHVIARSKAKGSVECLRLLLNDHGENIEIRNYFNQTPLHVAAAGED